MAIPNSSIRKHGQISYHYFFENGVRKRASLRTDSPQMAKER